MVRIEGKSKAKLKRMIDNLLKHIDEKDFWVTEFEQESVRAIDEEYCGGIVPRHMATGLCRFKLTWQKMPKKKRKAIHKKTVRSLRKVECVQDLAAMPAKERTDLLVTASASCLGAIAHASHGGTMKKLEAKVQNATKQLPVSETLAAIG